MMDSTEEIAHYLKQLHMPTIRLSYEQIAEQAREESWSYEQYLNILYLAAKESETAVDAVLRMMIDKDIAISDEQVNALVQSDEPVPAVTEVFIPAVDLTCYDQLLVEVAS